MITVYVPVEEYRQQQDQVIQAAIRIFFDTKYSLPVKRFFVVDSWDLHDFRLTHTFNHDDKLQNEIVRWTHAYLIGGSVAREAKSNIHAHLSVSDDGNPKSFSRPRDTERTPEEHH